MTDYRLRKQRRPRRTEPVILFSVGSHAFAIAVSAIHEIRNTDSLAAAASAIAHPELAKVRHTLQRGRKTYYVVHAGVHFGMQPSRASLVLVLRDSPAAILIDRIEGLTEISALQTLPQAFRGEERRWYRGLALLDDRVLPVVNPAGFLSEKELELLSPAAGATLKGEVAHPSGEGAAVR